MKAITSQFGDVTSRVLLTRESGAVSAHALDLDIVAHGPTEASALESLASAVECQITFAKERNQALEVFHPAPKAYFDLWESVA